MIEHTINLNQQGKNTTISTYSLSINTIWHYPNSIFITCFKILFEQQYHDYRTAYYTGNTDDLKNAVSRGIPVIALVFTGQTLHYVPVVGYDETHFFIQDSVEEYRNVTGCPAYNERIDTATWDKMWNIPIESCQRLFVVVNKR